MDASADNKKLTITSQDGTEVINVENLTSAKMNLSYAESYEDDFDEDGTDEEFAISIELELKK